MAKFTLLSPVLSQDLYLNWYCHYHLLSGGLISNIIAAIMMKKTIWRSIYNGVV